MAHWTVVAIRPAAVTGGVRLIVVIRAVMNTAVPTAAVASILTVADHTSELNSLGSVIMAGG